MEKIKKLINSEIFSYVFWGATTTLFNIVVYSILCEFIEYWIANIFAIVSGKIYAYFVNKIFVFKSKCDSLEQLIKEIVSYILTRGATGIVDFFGVVILVTGLSMDEKISKYIITITVIILNYILGKKIVFVQKNKKKSDSHNQN